MLDQRTRALEEAHRLGKIGTWSYRLDTGRSARKGTLWGINGGQQDYATAGSGERTRAYLAGKQEARESGAPVAVPRGTFTDERPAVAAVEIDPLTGEPVTPGTLH